MGKTIALVEHLGTGAAPALAEELLALRGDDLSIDASKTDHIGALGQQVLVAACRQWAVDGHAFSISALSDAFRNDVSTLGVSPGELGAATADFGKTE